MSISLRNGRKNKIFVRVSLKVLHVNDNRSVNHRIVSQV